MIQTKDNNGVYHEVTKVFAGDTVQQEIIKIWSTDANYWVYEATDTVSGTLPLTFHADGSALVDYRLYGNTGGVGDRTENCLELRDGSFTKTTSTTNLTVTVINGVITFDGTVFELPSLMAEWKLNLDFYLDAGTYYITEPPPLTSGFGRYIKKYDDDSNIVSAGTSAFTLSERTHVYLAFYIYDKTFDNAQIKITLVEGSTPPASYEPYGYKLNMAVGSNILQSSEIEQDGWQAAKGTVPSKIVNPMRCRSKDIYQISGEKIFYDFKSLNINIAFVDSNGESLGGSGFISGIGFLDVPANAVKCLFIIANTVTSAYITPSQVIAAKIWASVDATTTPIYIGDEPLEADEYVDYQAGKIYRMINGVLTPTDPPVPLPALPTCEGTTVIDYDGTPAPSSVYVKYKKDW